MSLSTHPLTPRFGLEVLGVDLASVDEATFVALRALWQTEPLLLLRRQCLDEAELVALSRRFGELHVLRRDYVHPPRHPEVLYVSNLRTEAGTRLGTLGSSELGWHTDQSYQPRPATGAVFQAVEVPEGTGATEWCNTVLAYAALPDTVRAAIASRRGVSRYNAYERETGFDEARKAALRAQHPPVAHPLVLTHPVSGERGLYLDISTTYAVEGMDDVEARALLASLAEVMTRPEHVYTHHWRPGDVMLWDNARLCHRRDPIDLHAPRLAKRTTIYMDPARFPVPAA